MTSGVANRAIWWRVRWPWWSEASPIQNRLGIAGWSWGGYLTAWTITQTSIFRAAVMGAGLANMVSDHGQGDIPSANLLYYPGQPYHHMEDYWKSSPIRYVSAVRTPTLILHGEEDARVHPAQGMEYFPRVEDPGCAGSLRPLPAGEARYRGARASDRRDAADYRVVRSLSDEVARIVRPRGARHRHQRDPGHLTASRGEQASNRFDVDFCLGHQVVDQDRLIGAVSVLAAGAIADGVDSRLAVEASVRGAGPGDEILGFAVPSPS